MLKQVRSHSLVPMSTNQEIQVFVKSYGYIEDGVNVRATLRRAQLVVFFFENALCLEINILIVEKKNCIGFTLDFTLCKNLK